MITIIEQDGWKVQRRIGVGDRENVRAGLMQIGCLISSQSVEQVNASFAFADSIQKTLRFYIDGNKLRRKYSDDFNQINSIMGRRRNHDIMVEDNLSDRKRFDWVVGRCDFLIYPDGGNENDLLLILKELWKNSNGREWHPNLYPKTESELKILYPQFYGGEDELWERINSF